MSVTPLDGGARWPIQKGTDVPHALPTVRAARDEAAQTVDANTSQNSGEARRSCWEGSTTEWRGPGFGRAFVASGIGFVGCVLTDALATRRTVHSVLTSRTKATARPPGRL